MDVEGKSPAMDVEEKSPAMDVKGKSPAMDVEEKSPAMDVTEKLVAMDFKGKDEKCAAVVNGKDEKEIASSAIVKRRLPSDLYLRRMVAARIIGFAPNVIRYYVVPEEYAVGPPGYKALPPGWKCTAPNCRPIPPDWDAVEPKEGEPVVEYDVPVPNIHDVPYEVVPPQMAVIFGNAPIPKGWHLYLPGWKIFLPGWSGIPSYCAAMPPDWKSVPRKWQLIPPTPPPQAPSNNSWA